MRSAPVNVVPIKTTFDRLAPMSIAFERLVCVIILFEKSLPVRSIPDMSTSARLVLSELIPTKLVTVNSSIIFPSIFLK